MNNVMVVDDTKNIRLLLTKCLELEGYAVKTANDGQEALELFQNERFDLAFLDIKMPHLSGTEVLKKIRDMGITTPVIIITAYATVKNAVECTQMGAVAYLQKPFTADKVRAVLSELSNLPCSGMQTADADFYIRQAESAISKGFYDRAIELLKRVISIGPQNANIYLLFSKAYQGMEDTEHAEKFYNMYQVLSR